MTIIFFFKCFKFDVDSRNWMKNWERVFCFSDNCIWIRSCKFWQYWTGYLPSGVSVLTKTPKILPNTMVDIFQINFPQNDENTWKKRSHGDFVSFWDTFTFLLSKRVPKRGFSQSGLRKLFTVSNFGNTLAMTIIFEFKMFKIWWIFQKLKKKKKWWKCFTFFR